MRAFQKSQEAAINAEFYELEALSNPEHAAQLQSFSVIDEQSGILWLYQLRLSYHLDCRGL